ncbi:MAG: hypothetical protein QOJ73_2098 [Streptosporangiaceae bacterium]|jgi:hypothetical protein|nr:hypothetical protein [Streptosporangiaceae bacterium]
MARVHGRIFLAVGAWLLGAGAATGGSLVAVSLLGQSLAAPPTQQLTVAAVNRALANASKEPTATPSASASGRPAVAVASPSVSPSASAGGAPGGKLLLSPGGSVVAECGPSGAYLISWSPQQGYQADDVARGPASRVSVIFDAGQSGVRMVVSCAGSTPVAAVGGANSDDGSGGTGDS